MPRNAAARRRNKQSQLSLNRTQQARADLNQARQAKQRAEQKEREALALLPVPSGTFAKAGGGLGSLAGGYLGQMLGQARAGKAVGQKIGSLLGGEISRLVGFGDYTVRKNSFLTEGGAVPSGEQIPRFGFAGHGTRIRHREMVKDVTVPTTPADFDVQGYAINPSNKALFPWLADVASQFQEYIIHGMLVEFRSLSSDITTGGPLGAVIIATNYNANSPVFDSKIEMENAEYSCSAKPSQSLVHTIECARHEDPDDMLWVRQAVSPSIEQDDRLYDLGTLQVATKGLPGTAGDVLGELWVTYDIELFKPVMGKVLDFYSIEITGTDIKGAVFNPNDVGYGPHGTICSNNGLNTLTFETSGEFQVCTTYTGTGISVSRTFNVQDNTVHYSGAAFGSQALSLHNVRVEAGDTITWDYSGSTTITQFEVAVWAYPYAYNSF